MKAGGVKYVEKINLTFFMLANSFAPTSIVEKSLLS